MNVVALRENQHQLPHDEVLPIAPTQKRAVSRRIQKSLRYPSLIGLKWQFLPKSIQLRFIKLNELNSRQIFLGHILKSRISFSGKLLERLCWLLSAPLPISTEKRGDIIVTVSEARDYEGQIWTRIYLKQTRQPHIVTSSIRFGGKTGLEEMFNSWLGLSIKTLANHKSLSFTSDQFFIKCFRKKIYIPKWMTPIGINVTHRECNARRFRLTIEVVSRPFGELIYQTSILEEVDRV